MATAGEMMIGNISHVGVTVDCIESHIAKLTKSGFTKIFLDKDVPNKSEKRPLLKNYSATHDLALLRHIITGFHVELVQYEKIITKNRFAYSLSFPEAAAFSDLPGIITSKYGSSHFAIYLHTNSFAMEVNFWCQAAGFQLEEKSTGSCRLEKRFPGQRLPFTLIINNNRQKRSEYHMDQLGVNFLALLSTNVMKDSRIMECAGGSLETEPFELSVNGNNLEITLLRSPGGALLELVRPIMRQSSPMTGISQI